MNKIIKTASKLLSFNLITLVALDLILVFALARIIWGELIPQVSSLGLAGYIGIFVVLSIFNAVLERIPEPVKTRRQWPPPVKPKA